MDTLNGAERREQLAVHNKARLLRKERRRYIAAVYRRMCTPYYKALVRYAAMVEANARIVQKRARKAQRLQLHQEQSFVATALYVARRKYAGGMHRGKVRHPVSPAVSGMDLP